MWCQLAAAAVGIWLMAAPAVLGFGRPAAVSAWIAGPIIASFAIVAAWGATRAVRWINLLPGLWLVAAPLVLDHPPAAVANSVLCGLLVLVLTPWRGRVSHRFGGGWRTLWRGDTGGDRAPQPA